MFGKPDAFKISGEISKSLKQLGFAVVEESVYKASSEGRENKTGITVAYLPETALFVVVSFDWAAQGVQSFDLKVTGQLDPVGIQEVIHRETSRPGFDGRILSSLSCFGDVTEIWNSFTGIFTSRLHFPVATELTHAVDQASKFLRMLSEHYCEYLAEERFTENVHLPFAPIHTGELTELEHRSPDHSEACKRFVERTVAKFPEGYFRHLATRQSPSTHLESTSPARAQ
ncbi:hypothetical protein A2215_01290 [Candidatus Berkelbacteria bacterium RIFOXYA2_FULL_43_10]|uniref:DUF4304 domain-containing protein n=1 Tax=Candidatus Berkelbacteria bacterium RIFOXYA2_FULL_43_10 TaxID=1797472 RepID=A0A1F5E965_9BACT|nr:MAG: hypothetical protein A2215_01290 [Candidatus Berkelbacteria bacterium RIFOXYA2_FULL_43_10]